MTSIVRAFVAGLLAVAVPGVMAESPVKKPVSPSASAVARLSRAVARLAQMPAVATGTVGFYVAPLDHPDRPLATRNHRQSFITASTMKTLTTGAALEILGPDFRFATTLWHDRATGDLIIKGAGDPTLARRGWDDLFAGWLGALRSAGIHEVTGRIIADESAWESPPIPDGWQWLDIGNYYAPPLTPLTFHDNEFRLYFRLEGAPGDAAGFYDAEPWPDRLQIVDDVRIGRPGTGDAAYVSGGPGATRYTVRGTLALDAGRDAIRAALPDAALFGVQQLTAWLNARSIPVHGAPATTRQLTAGGTPWAAPGDLTLISTHQSEPLRDLLIPINHRSLNLDCECLLRTLGEGQARAGLQKIREHLTKKDLPLAGYEQTDGSGLSRTNMITPELLARANAAVLNGPHGADFLASLPVIGEPDSTLRKLQPLASATTVHAKSGAIERVKAYTGVVESARGRRFVFAIAVNNYDGPDPSVSPGLAAVLEALAAL